MADEFTPIETQEQLDAVVKERVSRATRKAREDASAQFADYDELKEQAGQLAEALKRVDELTAAVAERDESIAAAKRADELRAARDKVAKETGVPAELVRGEDEESMRALAQAIKDHYEPVAPVMGHAGKFAKDGGSDGLRELTRSLLPR